MIITSVLDNDNNQYTDETVGFHTGGFHAGVFTDPKTFDVYFGDSYPPPKVISNGTEMKYDPPGDLNWSTDYFWRVDVWNANGDLTSGNEMEFTTRGENSPPNEPKPVFPPNGAENLSICYGTIEWNCTDPDGDDLTYEIYFGNSNPPPLIESNWSKNTYDPSPYEPTFEFETSYYWKIVAWDLYGENATGGIWEFKTEKNVPPNPAKDPIPPNGSRRVPINIILRWNGSDPNLCDTLFYDFYFGLHDPPTQWTDKQTWNYFDPYGPEGDLQLNETYYWKIVTWDKSGEKSIGPVWTFSTDPWCPPPPPEIDGPNQGKTEVVYEFDFVSYYFNNFSIIYEIEWGDGTMIESGPHEYGEIITLNHSWNVRGTYIIKARTKDENEEYSDWAFHKIVIPRYRSLIYSFDFFNLLFDRYPILIKLLSFLE